MTKVLTLSIVAIVDDDDLVARSLKRVISSSGYRVEVFASAEEFLDSDCFKECNCLILDVQMPGISGLQLQRQLATRKFRFPIIFITSHSDEASKAQALKAGAVDYLHKPFREEQLLDAIRKAFDSEERRQTKTSKELSCADKLAVAD